MKTPRSTPFNTSSRRAGAGVTLGEDHAKTVAARFGLSTDGLATPGNNPHGRVPAVYNQAWTPKLVTGERRDRSQILALAPDTFK